MKKLLLIALALMSFQTAFAANDVVNVKMNISGAKKDNSYFLCMEGVGCLSILAGKSYPIMHPVEVNGVYVMDVDSNYRVTSQGLPSTCDTTVATNHTLTITGSATPTADGGVKVNHLACRVS